MIDSVKNKYDIRIAGRKDSAEWDSFVESSENGTLFHELKFLSYHEPGRFNFHNMMFMREGRLEAVLPAALAERGEQGGTALVSPAGASFGGLVIKKQADAETAAGLVSALTDHAREIGAAEICHASTPYWYWALHHDNIEFALEEAGYESAGAAELSVVVPVSANVDIMETFRGNARTAVRQARSKGVNVRLTDDIETFHWINLANKASHGTMPTHSLGELETIRELYAGRFFLLGAFLDGQMIGGLLMFMCNSRAALTFYICHLAEFQQYRAVNLLAHEAASQAAQLGAKWLDTGTVTSGGVINRGLLSFKESLGGVCRYRNRHLLKQISD
ncbi:MAG: GNAT family N-acetyltransferase [bacterium]